MWINNIHHCICEICTVHACISLPIRMEIFGWIACSVQCAFISTKSWNEQPQRQRNVIIRHPSDKTIITTKSFDLPHNVHSSNIKSNTKNPDQNQPSPAKTDTILPHWIAFFYSLENWIQLNKRTYWTSKKEQNDTKKTFVSYLKSTRDDFFFHSISNHCKFYSKTFAEITKQKRTDVPR